MLIFMLLLMGITTTTHAAKLGSTLQERMAADEPLEDPVDQCKQAEPNLKVPNVVHYIWFGCKRKFLSYHYLSVLSALSVQNACQVFFHTDCEPPETNMLFQHLKENGVFNHLPPIWHFQAGVDTAWSFLMIQESYYVKLLLLINFVFLFLLGRNRIRLNGVQWWLKC